MAGPGVRAWGGTTYREGMRRVAKAGAAIAAGMLALAGTGVIGGTAGAQEDSAELGGFGMLARSTGIRIFYDSEKSPNPYPPTFEGTIPEVVASYEAGVGRAFASIIWPGPLLGNLGNVAPLLLPPGPITEIAKGLNWPLRAESTSSDPEPEHTLEVAPGSGMRTYADDRRAEAEGSFESYGTPGVISVGTITSTSTNRIEAGKVVAEAVSAVEDIAIGPGGLITIESVKSTAIASSDGKQGTSDAHTTISGVKVAGMPATLDENGLTLATQKLGRLLDPIIEQANSLLEAIGFEVIFTPVEKLAKEGDVSASASSSGILIRITGTIPPLPAGARAQCPSAARRSSTSSSPASTPRPQLRARSSTVRATSTSTSRSTSLPATPGSTAACRSTPAPGSTCPPPTWPCPPPAARATATAAARWTSPPAPS